MSETRKDLKDAIEASLAGHEELEAIKAEMDAALKRIRRKGMEDYYAPVPATEADDLKSAVDAALAESDSAMDPRQPPPDTEKDDLPSPGEPTAPFYPVASPLPLADFERRLELCRKHGVLHYEDHGLNIRFSEGQRPSAGAEPHVTEDW